MTDYDLASILRRLANRIGKDNQLHVVRALNDEADFISPHPKPEPREGWVYVSSFYKIKPKVHPDDIVHVREVLD